ncbi:MAG: acyl-CoA dehydrogenase [Myxococcales bacterium]|nr:acyl-CoA dehydrogenase [Myxococcales bacterium]
MMHVFRPRDLDFLLYDVLSTEALCESERFAQHDREVFDSILETARKLAEDKFETHACDQDSNPPRLEHGEIKVAKAVKAATDAFIENGFSAGPFPEKWGGLALPSTIVNAYTFYFNAANIATSTYVGLTIAAANMLMNHGDDAVKEMYLPHLVAGVAFGTMCLSEPHAGSSLANLKTTATPRADGTYQITGNKMWITGADHDLSDNIYHFVLARLPDAAVGTKGISLFLVPKFEVNEDGSLGERNDVKVVGLNHKMGYRGSVNGVVAFGETGACRGRLVGIPHAGLSHMFHMMNEARVGTGMAAVSCAYAGYRHSLIYAQERPQGFKLGQRDQSQPEVMIIEHADVRRMLIQQKAYVEGSLHLVLYCAQLMDRHEIALDAKDEKAGELDFLLALLTPIAKAWVSEHCIDANRAAMQVLGGCGYTKDYPVERLYRDNRLNAIVEGTTGIQALDLLGRKVTMGQGAALRLLMAEIQKTLAAAKEIDGLGQWAEALDAKCQLVAQATMSAMGAAMNQEIEKFLCNATPYLNALGHVVIGWMWLEQAVVAKTGLAARPDDSFLLGKVQTCQYFYEWELPRVEQWTRVLTPIETTCLDMQTDWF